MRISDWSSDVCSSDLQKLKKAGDEPPVLRRAENPDLLRAIATTDARRRPALVVGFAAETEQVVDYATKKLKTKGCDWILANDVGTGTGTFGGDSNTIHLVRRDADKSGVAVEHWPTMSKAAVAAKLADAIAGFFSQQSPAQPPAAKSSAKSSKTKEARP